MPPGKSGEFAKNITTVYTLYVYNICEFDDFERLSSYVPPRPCHLTLSSPMTVKIWRLQLLIIPNSSYDFITSQICAVCLGGCHRNSECIRKIKDEPIVRSRRHLVINAVLHALVLRKRLTRTSSERPTGTNQYVQPELRKVSYDKNDLYHA